MTDGVREISGIAARRAKIGPLGYCFVVAQLPTRKHADPGPAVPPGQAWFEENAIA